jgi:outer membrane protein OmpA-like peptidoglycan-associated protein
MKAYYITVLIGMAVALNGCATTGKMSSSKGTQAMAMNPQTQDFSSLGTVVSTEKGFMLTVSGDLLFKAGHSHLSPEGAAKIGAIATALSKYPADQVTVTAYTDNSGSEAGNLRISEKRAKAVLKELVKQGFSAANLTSAGKGVADPVAPNDTPENQAKNRRIEFVIVTP